MNEEPIAGSAPAPETSVQKGRFEFLDCARGLAALAVVTQHAADAAFPNTRLLTQNYFSPGIFGVVLFFLVSGFIIPVSVEKAGDLKRFWIARVFRLYPLYWFSLWAAVAFGLADPTHAGGHGFYLSIAANATMFQQFLGIPDALGIYWTLGLELAFYGLCSGLFVVGCLEKKRILAGLSVAGVIGLSLAALFVLHRSLPFGRILLLVIAFAGSYLHSVFTGRESFRSYLSSFLPFILAAITLGLWVRFGRYPPSRDETEPVFSFLCVIASWLAAYGIFLLLFQLRSKEFPRFSLWLGTVSYSLYLVHLFAIHFVPHIFPASVWFVLVVLSSISISPITWRLIEQPGIAFGRKLLRRGPTILRPAPQSVPPVL